MPRNYRCGHCNKLFLSLGYVLDHSTICPLKNLKNNDNQPNNLNLPKNNDS
jgi:hypothetical protein